MGKKGRRFKINFKNPFKRRRNQQSFQPRYNNNNNNSIGLVLVLIIIIAIGAVYIATSCPIAPSQQQLPDTPNQQQPVDVDDSINEADMFSPFRESYLSFARFMF